MVKKEDLFTLRKSMKSIGQLREQIAALELRRISPRSVAYGAERVQSSVKGDIQIDQIVRIDELIDGYRTELNKILDLQAEFEKLITPLSPLEKRIMRYYYIDGMIWEQVWEKTDYCTRHLRRIHNKILDELFPRESEL